MKTYDFIFSMGFSCAVSQALRDLGLQRVSLPLDWVGTPSVVGSARMIADDFTHWFDREDLRLWDVRHEHGHISRVYKNVRTGFGFSHEFTNAARLEDTYDSVRGKYARRIERFMKMMASVRRVLAIYLESPRNGCADAAVLQEALSVLRTKFPKTEIDFAYLYEDPEAKTPETVSDRGGLIVARLDYRTFLNGRLMHLCQGAPIRRWISENVTAANPMSPDEMRKLRNERRRAFRQSLGRNPIERWINRKLKGLYVDLDDYLIAQGIVIGDHPLWFDGDGK